MYLTLQEKNGNNQLPRFSTTYGGSIYMVDQFIYYWLVVETIIIIHHRDMWKLIWIWFIRFWVSVAKCCLLQTVAAVLFSFVTHSQRDCVLCSTCFDKRKWSGGVWIILKVSLSRLAFFLSSIVSQLTVKSYSRMFHLPISCFEWQKKRGRESSDLWERKPHLVEKRRKKKKRKSLRQVVIWDSPT